MPDKPRMTCIRQHPYEPVSSIEEAAEYHARLATDKGFLTVESGKELPERIEEE